MDGVKVFKPTRNDKRVPKTFQLVKDTSGIATPAKAQLVQSKLNFTKKEETVTSKTTDKNICTFIPAV